MCDDRFDFYVNSLSCLHWSDNTSRDVVPVANDNGEDSPRLLQSQPSEADIMHFSLNIIGTLNPSPITARTKVFSAENSLAFHSL